VATPENKKYSPNPFTNLPLKQKLMFNMFLAVIGFFAISTVPILSHSELTAIITINVIFTVLVAYTNWAAYVRIQGGVMRFRRYIRELMDFVFMRSNVIERAKYTKNDEIGMILSELNNYVDSFDNMRKEDMKIIELVVF